MRNRTRKNDVLAFPMTGIRDDRIRGCPHPRPELATRTLATSYVHMAASVNLYDRSFKLDAVNPIFRFRPLDTRGEAYRNEDDLGRRR
jgi:hypothetical protein